jgi:flagellar L-ring protein FlgH
MIDRIKKHRPKRIAAHAGLVLIIGGLSACAARPREIGREPELSPVGTALVRPATAGGVTGAVQLPVARQASPVSTGSLWRDKAADIFKDPRARRVGDLLTVTISMNDKATFDNSSKRSRNASHGFGLDISQSVDWAGLVSSGTAKADSALKSNTAQDGKGAIARSENIELKIAAAVTEVLPNGHLLIQGSQELRVNYELRVLTFTGVVNVADIKPDNTIPHDRIGEARVSYGGRGRIMEVQQPAWGHQIIDLLFPF